jgi:hypothetical protein
LSFSGGIPGFCADPMKLEFVARFLGKLVEEFLGRPTIALISYLALTLCKPIIDGLLEGWPWKASRSPDGAGIFLGVRRTLDLGRL